MSEQKFQSWASKRMSKQIVHLATKCPPVTMDSGDRVYNKTFHNEFSNLDASVHDIAQRGQSMILHKEDSALLSSSLARRPI
jgi:hypothetical protein